MKSQELRPLLLRLVDSCEREDPPDILDNHEMAKKLGVSEESVEHELTILEGIEAIKVTKVWCITPYGRQLLGKEEKTTKSSIGFKEK